MYELKSFTQEILQKYTNHKASLTNNESNQTSYNDIIASLGSNNLEEINKFDEYFRNNYPDNSAQDLKGIKQDIISYHLLTGLDETSFQDDFFTTHHENVSENIAAENVSREDRKRGNHQVSESYDEGRHHNKKVHLERDEDEDEDEDEDQDQDEDEDQDQDEDEDQDQDEETTHDPKELFEGQKKEFIAQHNGQLENSDFTDLHNHYAQYLGSPIDLPDYLPPEMLVKNKAEMTKILKMRIILNSNSTPTQLEPFQIQASQYFLIEDFYKVMLLFRANEYAKVSALCEVVIKNISKDMALWEHRPSCPLIPYYHQLSDDLIQKTLHPMIDKLPISEIYYYHHLAQKALGVDPNLSNELLAQCFHHRALQCFIRGMYQYADIYIKKGLAIYRLDKTEDLQLFVELFLNAQSDEIIRKYDTPHGLEILKKHPNFCFEYFLFLDRKKLTRPKIVEILIKNQSSLSAEKIGEVHKVTILSLVRNNSTTFEQIEKAIKDYQEFSFEIFLNEQNSNIENILSVYNQTLIHDCSAFFFQLNKQKNVSEADQFLHFWLSTLKNNHAFYESFGDSINAAHIKEREPGLSFCNFQYERFYINSLRNCLAVLILLQTSPYIEHHLLDVFNKFKQHVATLVENISKYEISSGNGDNGITRKILNDLIDFAFSAEKKQALSDLQSKQEMLLDENNIKEILNSLKNNYHLGPVPEDLMDRWPSFKTVLSDNHASNGLKFVEFHLYLLNASAYFMQAHVYAIENEDKITVLNVFKNATFILRNLILLFGQCPDVSHDNINNASYIEHMINLFILEHLDKIKFNIDLKSLLEFNSSFEEFKKSHISLLEKYKKTSGEDLNSHSPNSADALSKLNATIQMLQRNEAVTGRPLSFLYGKKESSQIRVDFPTDKIEDRMRQNQTHAFKDSANISVHYITVVYRVGKQKAVLHIPVPHLVNSSSHPVITLDDLDCPEYQKDIIGLIQQGDEITKLSMTDNTLVIKEFENKSHKHSEQAFFVWLLKHGVEFIVKKISEEPSLRDKQEKITILVISFDYGSKFSSCKHCALASIAIQSKEGKFAKDLSTRFVEAGYQLPSTGIHLTSRVLYTRERTSDSYYKTLTPQQKNAKFFDEKVVLSEMQPAMYGSGGAANKIFALK